MRLAQNTCSCGAKGSCAHSIAARKVAGIQEGYEVPRYGRAGYAATKIRKIARTPGRRKPVGGSKKPSRELMQSDTINPYAARRSRYSSGLSTPMHMSEDELHTEVGLPATPTSQSRSRLNPGAELSTISEISSCEESGMTSHPLVSSRITNPTSVPRRKPSSGVVAQMDASVLKSLGAIPKKTSTARSLDFNKDTEPHVPALATKGPKGPTVEAMDVSDMTTTVPLVPATMTEPEAMDVEEVAATDTDADMKELALQREALRKLLQEEVAATDTVSASMTQAPMAPAAEAMDVSEMTTTDPSTKSTGTIAKKKATASKVKVEPQSDPVVSSRITITDSKTQVKQAAAARAKARGSKVIEKWEDKERMTVNSNEDVLTCQLRLGEVAKVKSDDGKEVVVKNTKSGHVAVFCDKEEDISPELMEASVGLVAEQAKFYKTTGKYQAKVAICSSDTMTKEEAALGTTATSKLDYQLVEMSCTCGRGTIVDANNTFKCSDCTRTYHKTCAPYESDTQCKPCASDFQGMRWSSTGNYTNTCPADTAMTPFVDHVLNEDPGLLADFKKKKKLSATEKDYINACSKVTEGTRASIDEGHDIFASRTAKIAYDPKAKVKRAKNDCFTSYNEITNEFKATATFEREVTCPGVGGNPCRRKNDYNEYNNILLEIDAHESMEHAIDRAIREDRVDPNNGGRCSSCHRKCPTEEAPIVMEKPLGVIDRKNPPCFLNFQTTGAISKQDAFQAPEKISVSGIDYNKKSIVVNHDNSHYTAHFKRGDMWLTYDGLAGNMMLPTTPAEKIQTGTSEIVEQISYYKAPSANKGAGKTG